MSRMGLFALFFVSSYSLLAQEREIAFPGADGFGKYASGGRGGKIVSVTNLNNDGPGSLRAAINQEGPRIIVFAISGNIELAAALDIKNDHVTIAGQSAPGDGICVKNFPLNVEANNVIIRFMRFRLGDEKAQQDDSFGGTKEKENIIIDHCSVSWATDECASFYHNKNFTLQWCIISESLNQSVHEKGDHGYGGIWGGVNASFHHNLLASHNSRMPRFSGSSTTLNSLDELVDFRNNVIYNWMSNNTYGGEKGKYNIVNNYYKLGPATTSKKIWFINPSVPYGQFFLSGNYLLGKEDVNRNNVKGVKSDHPDSAITNNAFEVEPIVEQSAEEAYGLVLKFAGASLCRDAVDARIVEEVGSGKSSFGKNKNGIIDSQKDVGGWPMLKSSKLEKDSDSDGLPDQWEKKNKLNPNDPGDANTQTIDSSYSNIEIYLNSLVDKVIIGK
ncbi:MAG TPA: pectate lyase [Cyclobacteriaceae bacterium]